MATQLNIPFHLFRLRFASGPDLWSPLLDAQTIALDRSPEELAQLFQENMQQEILKDGRLIELLNLRHSGKYKHQRLTVDLPAGRGQITPAMQLEFDYISSPLDSGQWGIVPVLGVEASAPDPNTLEENLRDVIRLDFKRNFRLIYPQLLASVLWFSEVELQEMQLKLNVPKLGEHSTQTSGSKPLLPALATPLKPEQAAIWGRAREMEQLMQVLRSPFNRNALLVGAPGSGKTALIEEAVRRLYGEPRIWETTAARMIKELIRETSWEANVPALCRELQEDGGFLYVTNLKELFEVGQYAGNNTSIAEFMRTYLERGEVAMISECTEEELARMEVRNPSLMANFQVIRLQELPETEMADIIHWRIAQRLEQQKVEMSTDSIAEAIRLFKRFSPYAGLPGRIIRFLENAILHAQARMKIDRQEVIRLFCEESGLPNFMIDPAHQLRKQQVLDFFAERVFGQTSALQSLAATLISVKAAMTPTGKPISSFLFVGPTGVGKTEVAKVLSHFMFSSPERMLRFDMSEYSTFYAVNSLLGSNWQPGKLTSAVRREPFSVVLFDEIEKAHPSFYDLLLQVLDEGRLTDGAGEVTNFCSTIIIMTSNIGAERLQQRSITLHQQDDQQNLSDAYLKAVEQYFRPELVNRIDQIVPFHALGRREVAQVVKREIRKIHKRDGILYRKVQILIEEEVYGHLAEIGYDPRYGARHMQRVLRRQLVIPLARTLNLSADSDEVDIRVSLKDEALHIDFSLREQEFELYMDELKRINLANVFSARRRRLQTVRRSGPIMRLNSSLDLWESEKRQKKEAFWQEKGKAERYLHFQAARETLEGLNERIEKLEADAKLIALGALEPQEEKDRELQEWDDDFFRIQQEIHQLLYPSHNRCLLSIYGKLPMRVLLFYQHLLEKQEYDYSAEAIWFRSGKKGQKGKFIKKSLQSLVHAYDKPVPNADLYGVELKIKGPSCQLFWEAEEGLHHWKTKGTGKPLVLRVDLHQEEKIQTPDNIHRHEFYKAKPRRVVGTKSLTDTFFNLEREADAEKQLELLLQALRNHLSNRIENAWQ